MTPGEMIECGQLMQAHAAGTTSPEQVVRMRALMAIAKRDLSHDDPSTPRVDEGDTEIVRAQKREVALQQRMADLEKKLEQLGETLLEKLLEAAPALLVGLTKR